MERNNGGPAFPTENERQTGAHSYHFEGMSLRDWFAGQVLAGMIRADHRLRFNPDDDAAWAYRVADAMLAAREKRDADR